MDHRSDCRLLSEVLPRLGAIQHSCRWNETTDTAKIESAEKLAGWAAAHLAVVIEHGCNCSPEGAAA